jgi:hypothetical protein
MGQARLRARLALGKRDQHLAERHARGLNGLGFEVVRVGSRGVGFEGPIDLFERVFQCGVMTSKDGAQFSGEPTIPKEIREEVDSVYFPTRPIFPYSDSRRAPSQQRCARPEVSREEDFYARSDLNQACSQDARPRIDYREPD